MPTDRKRTRILWAPFLSPPLWNAMLIRFEHTTVAYDKDAAKYALTYSTISAFEQDSTPRWFCIFDIGCRVLMYSPWNAVAK